MAEKELVFGIKVDTKQAEKATKNLSKNLDQTSGEFKELQKQVDATNASVVDFQKVVDKSQKSTGDLGKTANMSFKAFQRQNKVLTNNAAILKAQAKQTKTNSQLFKEMEGNAEGARMGLQLFGEVILGIPGDIVTKLFDSFEVLGEVIKKGFTGALKSAITVMKGFLVVLKNVTIAIITNPLFFKAAIIVAGIVAVIVAIRDMEERFNVFSEILASIGALFGSFEEDTRRTATTLEIIGRTFKNVGIIILSGFLTPILLVVRGLLELRRALTTDEDTLFKLDAQIAGLENTMINFAEATGQAVEELNPYTAAANIAAEKTAKLRKEQELAQAALAKGIVGLDTATETTNIFGSEFEKASMKVKGAQKALKDIQEQFGKAGQGKKDIKGLVDASGQLFLAQLELKKISGDAFKDFAAQAKQSELDLLKTTGQVAKARREENKQAAEELDNLVKQVVKFGSLTAEQEKSLKGFGEQIKKNAQAEIDFLEEQEKKDKEKEKRDKDQAKRDKEREDALKRSGELGGLMQQAGGIAEGLGLEGVGEALTGAAAQFGLTAAAGFITAIAAIPDLLSGAADFLDKFTELGPNIIATLGKFGDALIGLITDGITNLFESLPTIIKQLIDIFLFELPNAILALSDMLPDLIVGLVEEIPALVEAFVQGFITRLPKLVIASVNLIAGLVTKVIPAIVKALPDIGEAIIVGILEAILEIAELIKRLFSGEALVEQAGKLGEAVGEGLKASSSEIFQVIDLEQQRLGKEAGQFIVDNTKKAISIWRRFWEFVTKIWDKIIENLTAAWHIIVDALEAVFVWVRDKIFKPIGEGLQAIFDFVKRNIFDPIVQGFDSAFETLREVFQVFTNAFQAVWTWVDEHIIGPLGDVITAAVNVFASILNPVIDVLNSIKIPGVSWSVSAGRLGSWSGKLFDDIVLFNIPKIQAMQEGGLVGGQGEGDIIPTLLEPGEFVLTRDAVQGLGLPAVEALNRGETGGGMGTTINFAPTINVSGRDFNPNDVVETMFTELRRRSSNGTKVIFAQGIKQ